MRLEGLHNQRERGLDRTNIKRAALEMAREEVSERRIRMHDFASVIDPDILKTDQSGVVAAETEFEEQMALYPEKREEKEIGDIAEGIFLGHTTGPKWFGQNTRILPTARFDDINNHVDFLLQLPGGSYEKAWLGIDATSSYKKAEKFQDIRNDIDGNHLAWVKYAPWKLERTVERSDLTPLVVTGVSKAMLDELMELYISKKSQDRQRLIKHPVRHIYIEEALTQLKAFHAYAARKGKEMAANAIASRIPTVERIQSELLKQYPPPPGDGWRKDGVFHFLQEQARAFQEG